MGQENETRATYQSDNFYPRHLQREERVRQNVFEEARDKAKKKEIIIG